MKRLGVRVYGYWFRLQDIGFMVEGLGLRALRFFSLGFRV